MKKLIISSLTILIVSWPFTSMAISFTPQEISGIVQVKSYLSENSINHQVRSLAGLYTDDELYDYRQQLKNQEQQGSGFMITYSGCVLTNKHVVYDLAIDSAHKDIHLWATSDITQEPEDLGTATLVYYRTLDDIAIVCLDDTKGKFFDRIFVKTEDYNNLTINLGEDIYTLGYPSSGGDYLTLTSGLVSGVWDKDTIKTNMAITSGISGSPVFNSNKQVIGIAQGNTGPFDQLGLFLKPTFVTDWHEGYKSVYRSSLSDVSAGCMDTDMRGIYKKDNNEYYDLSCSVKRSFGLEAKAIYEYENYCQAELNPEDAVAVAEYIASNKSDINKWVSYLESSCLMLEPVSVFTAEE